MKHKKIVRSCDWCNRTRELQKLVGTLGTYHICASCILEDHKKIKKVLDKRAKNMDELVNKLISERDAKDAEKAWEKFASKYLLYFNQEKAVLDAYESMKLDIYKRGFIEGFNFVK